MTAPSSSATKSVRRIALTGGGGGVGRWIAEALVATGSRVVNFDQTRLELKGVANTSVDITQFGDVVSGFSGFDAIVHLAAVSAPGRASNNRLFHVNMQGTFNVLEAAALLGIRHVVLASSVNAVGMTFNLRPSVDYVPMDESHPCRPDEPYGLSKLAGELAADSFARRYPHLSISSLRFPHLVRPVDYQGPGRDDTFWSRCLWSYCDVREAARAVRLALEVEWTGHEVFFVAAGDTPVAAASQELIAQWHPHALIKSPLKGNAALIASAKAARLLGWTHQRTYAEWRDEAQAAAK